MQAPTLPDATHMGAVHLTVADLGRSVAFYTDALGLRVQAAEKGRETRLGAGAGDLLVLTEQPGAVPVRRRTGLFHFALLMPSRAALAHVLRRLAASGARLSGASDHLVSEALYLNDPDGHGIELYRDRPREAWTYEGGALRMATLPLDLEGLLSEPASGDDDTRAVMGHVHLHVADLEAALGFYRDVVGFELKATYPGAAFLSAGGYHHHLGINTWAGVGALPPPPEAARLRYYTVHVPTGADVDALGARLDAAGVPYERRAHGLLTRDPSENALFVTTSTQEQP